MVPHDREQSDLRSDLVKVRHNNRDIIMEKFQESHKYARSASTAHHTRVTSNSTLTDQYLDDEEESEEEEDISLHQAARDGHIDRLKVRKNIYSARPQSVTLSQGVTLFSDFFYRNGPT